MKPKDYDENAKSDQWKTPMKMKGVKPYTYDSNSDTSGGSRLKPSGDSSNETVGPAGVTPAKKPD